MAEVEITHGFVTAKADSADATLVSANEWNALLTVGGGVNGHIPVRDSTQTHGAKWTQGTTVQKTIGSSSPGTASTPALAQQVLTFTTNVVLIFTLWVQATSSAGQAIAAVIRRDGSNIALINGAGGGIGAVLWVDVSTELPGTHTYDVIVSVATGSLTTAQVSLTSIAIGT